MSPLRSFRAASRLGLATTILMFGLIVIGSVVRTTGSGLACPDWPLCHGRLIPPFEPHVLIEWFHRLVALVLGVLLGATAGWTLWHREVRARAGGLAGLAFGLYFVQALLGALTVWKLLDPSVVSGHLAVALLMFATLFTFTLVTHAEADALEWPATDPPPARPAGLLPVVGAALVVTWVQSVLGGMVSTHHAGLACPDWPTCMGSWFPPLEGGVGLQMVHRWGGYVLTLLVLHAAWRARTAPDAGIRAAAGMAAVLTLFQVGLGVLNVFLGVPVWLSALHLANATALLGVLVAVTCRVAALPAARSVLAPAVAR